MKDIESSLSRQERAARQQELLEQKRQSVANQNMALRKKETRSHFPEKEEKKKVRKEKTGKKPLNSWAFREKRLEDREVMDRYVSVSQWFLSICWLKIPFLGFIYALVMAFSRKTPPSKKAFAMAYLLYKILVMILALTVFYILYRVGLSFVDELLSYAK